ncbi:30S ribosomal protein S4 [Candidatus Mycoplasma haematominutum]|uniref:Small ribosomal subunit protein uS4 n=1 Tax=Candidatus Mycoplasma haematominutum 'Birmingham 1' TaxID=1116213 RepID=G8C301_9MOLU|nr:30S ribosomal protein S4 [Candidatus Mycoplasma haematominutum]CCE66699.1 ribosomal protein S4 [Candidatus Mycoplasma haematominutum 'Birmingham 1']
MGRYLGPLYKKSRQFGFSFYEDEREFSKGKQRSYPPGQHGPTKFKKHSLHGEQLREKQKMAILYGLRENQMRRFFAIAQKMKGSLSMNFLLLLESKLDNLVFRAGMANTRRAARQLVSHGHVLLNGKKVDIPSYIVAPSSSIEIKPKSQHLPIVNYYPEFIAPDFLQMEGKYKAIYIRYPQRSEINLDLNEATVTEWYTRYS